MPVLLHRIYRHPELSPDDLQTVIDAHTKVEFRKNELLLIQGQTSNSYYCLDHGLIRSFAVNSEGDEITTGFFGKGDIVIEVASIFLRIPTKENIQAITDCSCWKIQFEDFQKLYNDIQGFREWGRTWMSGELLKSKQRFLSMITDSASERYLSLEKEHAEILLHAPLKYIASYLGITDTSLSRIRKEVSKM